MEFQNNQVDTFTIPKSEDVQFEKLDPAYKSKYIHHDHHFCHYLMAYLIVGIFVDVLYQFHGYYWLLSHGLF